MPQYKLVQYTTHIWRKQCTATVDHAHYTAQYSTQGREVYLFKIVNTQLFDQELTMRKQ